MQMVTGACARQDEMRAVVDDWCADMAMRDGWLGGTYGFTDDDQFVGIVRFSSQRAYDACCASTDAGAHWAGALLCFDATPEIHQSEDVTIMLDGAFDEAGSAQFVQVIRGRATHPDRLRNMVADQEMTAMLHQARPEIVGATLLIEDDGSYTETIAFTDEAAARRGEQLEMPADVAADWQSAVGDAQYSDLHRPWFAKHS
jgi:hypothetical protein